MYCHLLSLWPSRSVGESACLLPARDYLTTQRRLREGDKSESFVEMVEGGWGVRVGGWVDNAVCRPI